MAYTMCIFTFFVNLFKHFLFFFQMFLRFWYIINIKIRGDNFLIITLYDAMIFGILFLSKRKKCHPCWHFHIDPSYCLQWKTLSNETKISTFYEEIFNSVGCLTCYILWLFLLFEYKRVCKSCLSIVIGIWRLVPF